MELPKSAEPEAISEWVVVWKQPEPRAGSEKSLLPLELFA